MRTRVHVVCLSIAAAGCGDAGSRARADADRGAPDAALAVDASHGPLDAHLRVDCAPPCSPATEDDAMRPPDDASTEPADTSLVDASRNDTGRDPDDRGVPADARPTLDAPAQPDADPFADAAAPDAFVVPEGPRPDAAPDGPPPEPITPEANCDGLDDDLDGVADEGFECAVGTLVDCETACGSTGKAACLPGCEPTECVPPAETCNGHDDDCDGRIDQGYACIQGQIRLCNPGCGQLEYQRCDADCQWTPCPAAPGCPEDGTVCDVDLDRDGFLDEGALELGHLVGTVGADELRMHSQIFSGRWYDPVIEGGSTVAAQDPLYRRTFSFPDSEWRPSDGGEQPIAEHEGDEYIGATFFHGDGEFTASIPFPVIDPEYFVLGALYDVGPYIMVDRVVQLELYDRYGQLVEAPIPGFVRPEFHLDPRPPGHGEAIFEPQWVFLCGDHVVCATGDPSPPQQGYRDDQRQDYDYAPDPRRTHFVRIDFRTGEMDVQDVILPQAMTYLGPNTDSISEPVMAPDGRSISAFAVRSVQPEAVDECGEPVWESAVVEIDEEGWHFGTYFRAPPFDGRFLRLGRALATSDGLVSLSSLRSTDGHCVTLEYSTGIASSSPGHSPELADVWPGRGLYHGPTPVERAYDTTLYRWDDHILVGSTTTFACDGECPQGSPGQGCEVDPRRCNRLVSSLIEWRDTEVRPAVIIDWDGRAGAYGGVPAMASSREGMPYLMHSYASGDDGSPTKATGEIIQPIQCAGRRRLSHAH